MGKFGTLHRPSTRGDCSKVRLRPGGDSAYERVGDARRLA